jgi:hypothetical protein
MDGQVCFGPNGNISPCPFTDICLNHPAGCGGVSYWCKRSPKDLKKGAKDGRTDDNIRLSTTARG